MTVLHDCMCVSFPVTSFFHSLKCSPPIINVATMTATAVAAAATAAISSDRNITIRSKYKNENENKTPTKKKKHTTTTTIQNDLANRHPDDLCIHTNNFLDQMSSIRKIDARFLI